MTTQLSGGHYCNDAAKEIALMIFDEELKATNAQRTRDKHRADTSVRALKQALQIVLLEARCNAVMGPLMDMPDVDAYLTTLRTPTV